MLILSAYQFPLISIKQHNSNESELEMNTQHMQTTYCVEYWFPSRSFKYKLRCVFQNLLFVISMWNRELPFFAYLFFDLNDRKAISWSRRKKIILKQHIFFGDIIQGSVYGSLSQRIQCVVPTVHFPMSHFPVNAPFRFLNIFFFHSPSFEAREIFLFCKFK